MNRSEAIQKRRADMPKVYRSSYDKAVSGKSLRAAVNSFCLECCMWEREEVRRCTLSPAPYMLSDLIREALKMPLRGLILAQNRKTLAMRTLGQEGVDYDANTSR